MPTTTIRYPFDPTGSATTNFISNEVQTLSNYRVRAVAPTYAPFFEASVVITDVATSRVLVYNTDYSFAELDQTASAVVGQAVSAVILITNTAVSSNISLSYQTVGGDFCYSATALVNLVQMQLDTSQVVQFDNIIDKPNQYPPTTHLHDASDLYGAQYIVQAIENVASAVNWSNSPLFYALVNLINQSANNLNASFNNQYQQNLQAALLTMASQLTPTTLGLGNLLNLQATNANDGTAIGDLTTDVNTNTINKYLTTVGLYAMRDKLVSNLVRVDTSGLGAYQSNVQPGTRAALAALPNGGVITFQCQQVLNSTSTAFEAMVYPTGTNQADVYTVFKISNNATNGGGVYIYVQNQSNKMFIGSTANESAWPTWSEVILASHLNSVVNQVTNLIAGHVANYSNPHNVTASQVGLGLVQNYDCVDITDVNLNRNVTKYVTMDMLQAWMNKWGASTVASANSQTTATTTSTGTVYVASLQINNEANQLVGYLFATTDTPDPAATQPLENMSGTIIGYGYPSATASATVPYTETGTSVTNLWLLASPTITVAGTLTTISAACITSVTPNKAAIGTPVTVTLSMSGLTAGKSYVITPMITDPTNTTAPYQTNGTIVTSPVVADVSGNASFSFSFPTGGLAAGSWSIGAQAVGSGETVKVTSVGGNFTLS